jgi:glycerol-3-phosphate acyltransferase PlsX
VEVPLSPGEPPVTVAVDCAGADMGPGEVAAGAAIAAREDGVSSILFGPRAEVEAGIADGGGAPDGLIEVIDAPVSIAKSAEPASAVRQTPDASVVQAARAVADGKAQAFVSGGSTGAALAAGTMIIRRDQGIHRPALAMPLPRPNTGGMPVTLLDVGANTEVRPEYLVQFAFMGAALAGLIGVENPRVALLSNGSEADRGTPGVREAHAALTERAIGQDTLRFVGSLEGTDLLTGVADVFITDGFTGNIALKVTEGVSQFLLKTIRDVAGSDLRSKAGGLLLKPGLVALRDDIDPERYGGAYMLGLRALGVVPHGRFSRVGFGNAVRVAARGAESNVVAQIHSSLASAGALRQPRAAAAATDPGDTVTDAP